MQHYMQIGLGFPASLLTEDAARKIYEMYDESISIESFTEDYEGKDWASLVVKTYGEIPRYGKMASIDELVSQSKKMKLTKKEEEHIHKIFEELNISHLIKEIKPIIYSNNY